MKLTLDELAEVRTILEKIEQGGIEPRIPGRMGRFLRQYSAGRAQLDRALAKLDLERRTDGALSGMFLGRVEVHPFLDPEVSALDYPLGEVAQTLAVSEELGGVLDVVMWLKGPVANSVYNFFRSHTGVAFSGDYRWTPPARTTPGEARLEACERQITWRDARCLKAVADDFIRPPHALGYVLDFRMGPPGIKYFRCVCALNDEKEWWVLPGLTEPRRLEVADALPEARRSLKGAELASLLIYREPWSSGWAIVDAAVIDANDALAHAITWADFQRELEGSEVDGTLFAGTRQALRVSGLRPAEFAQPNLTRSLIPAAREVIRSLRGLN